MKLSKKVGTSLKRGINSGGPTRVQTKQERHCEGVNRGPKFFCGTSSVIYCFWQWRIRGNEGMAINNSDFCSLTPPVSASILLKYFDEVIIVLFLGVVLVILSCFCIVY